MWLKWSNWRNNLQVWLIFGNSEISTLGANVYPADFAIHELSKHLFSLPSLEPCLEQCRRLLHEGTGVNILRDPDPARYMTRQNGRVFVGITKHLGTHIERQNLMGEKLCTNSHTTLQDLLTSQILLLIYRQCRDRSRGLVFSADAIVRSLAM